MDGPGQGSTQAEACRSRRVRRDLYRARGVGVDDAFVGQLVDDETVRRRESVAAEPSPVSIAARTAFSERRKRLP